jgi:tetratricopeptide (TPR) repeat protein
MIKMVEATQVQEFLEDVRTSIPSSWMVSDLEVISRSIISRWGKIVTDEEDIVAQAVDLAVANFSPSRPDDFDAVRRFCGLTMLLSFVSMSSPHSHGMFKAVIAATHSAIDILNDYDLGLDFCSKIAPMARSKGAWNVAILVTGDMGIALSRGKKFRDALSPLMDAVELSIKEDDYNSAARYSSELGLSYFELDDYINAASNWQAALNYAKRCQDKELQTQVLTNLRTLSSLNN